MGHKFGLRREGGARRREVWEHLQIKLWAAEEEFHVHDIFFSHRATRQRCPIL